VNGYNGDQTQLQSACAARIECAEPIGVSAIPCFEVSWLAHHRRIDLSCGEAEWFEKALDGSGITVLPVTARIARTAVQLPEHHQGPQGRLIIATALRHDATLIAIDDKFPQYAQLAGPLLH
jgi:PIN domain nuclease of toxin-antitoxin system